LHGITAGPDGALWFTNSFNCYRCPLDSLGRITTGGVVTNYTGTGISNPDGITAGPDGALWFTNFGSNSIGRITTDLAITTSSLPNATIGAPYSQTLSATGGVPPYTWKLALGSAKLPRGLKLYKSTGVISGTPTKRSTTSTFTVEVLDTKATTRPHTRDTATATFTITIS
jgi:Putative Ig domain